MGSHAGLKKVVKTVKGKKGIVKRSYWVKAKEAVKGAAKRLSGGISKASDAHARKNMAAYKRNSVAASAKTGFRVGALGGLMGAHRSFKGLGGAHVASQVIAAGTRRSTGTKGKGVTEKAAHGIGTGIGASLGIFAGGLAHEAGRAGIRAGVNAFRNRRK